MSDSWVTRAVSKNSTPVELSDELLEEKGVILLQGSNVYGDPIYSYLQLTIRSLQQLRERMQKGEKFLPGDFGTVLAAGRGEPNQELRSEMSVTYGLVDTPAQKKKSAASAPAPSPQSPASSGSGAGFSQPSIWDE